MATATAPAPATKDIASVLGVETLPIDQLRQQVDDLAISKAWADGRIEFGRRKYCCTGPVATPDKARPGSVLLIEEGEQWTGAKTKLHKSFRDIKNEVLPLVETYREYFWYEPKMVGEERQLRVRDISKDDAMAKLTLLVRLTDKGLGESV